MFFIFRPPEIFFAFSKIASFLKKISFLSAPGTSTKIVPETTRMRSSETKTPVSSCNIVCSFLIKRDSLGTNDLNLWRYSAIEVSTIGSILYLVFCI